MSNTLQGEKVELEVLPACREYGLAFLPYSPSAGGLLAGALEKPRNSDRYREITEKIEKRKKQIQAYETLCRELGEKPSVIALAWLLHQPGVSAPLIGPRTIEQLEECLRALEFDLDRETLESLDSIWPGPGQAPEAYTW